ncbi:hypothetical protein ACOSP7_004297 [Xanthoceras sorbifolium]
MENDLILGGRPIFAGKSIILSDELLQIAHHYILFNSSEVQPYVESLYLNTQDTPNTQVTQESNSETKKKTRGVTRMVKLKVNQPVEVDFNLHGQTIDGSSITLASYIGILVREHVPITLESWKKVDEQKKYMIWSSLLTKFGLDDIGKDYVLSSMCNCWRQYKSKITKKVRSVPPGPGATRAIQILRPDNIVDDEEWIKFVKFRLSSEFDGISRHYSELAKKNDTPQTTSRKGMTRLREELRLAKLEANEDSEEVDRVETWIAGHKHKDGMPVNENVGEKIKQMEAISLDKTTIIREDAVSQVLGNEHRGRVRGLGFGVTPTRVQVAVIGKQTTTQLQEEMKTLRQQVAEMKSALLTMQSTPAVSINEIGSGEVVAEAEIECTNPQTLVHHMILGPDHWKIAVKKILVRKVPLCRPTSELHVLEDARGTYIAWPSKYITY